jgi:hypothetical protein
MTEPTTEDYEDYYKVAYDLAATLNQVATKIGDRTIMVISSGLMVAMINGRDDIQEISDFIEIYINKKIKETKK